MPFPAVTDLIPHRAPQLFVDRILAVDGMRIVAERRFETSDVTGHFPGRPIVPGVFLVEALAQTLACFAALSGRAGQPWLTGVDKARFRGAVVPPVTATLEVEVTGERLGVTWARGRVLVGDDAVCTVNLQAVVDPDADGPANLGPPPDATAG